MLWIVLATAAFLAGALWAERQDDHRLKAICKPLASTGFLVAAVFAGALTTPFGQIIFAALILCWWGDVLLIPKGRKGFFLAGLIAFLLGHVAFGVAFVHAGIAVGPAALAGLGLGLAGAGFLWWLRPKVPTSLRAAVVAYILVITVMVALAVGAWQAGARWLLPLGAVIFWASDISVALDRFAGAGFANRLWGLPAYYAAQFVFVASLMSPA